MVTDCTEDYEYWYQGTRNRGTTAGTNPICQVYERKKECARSQSGTVLPQPPAECPII
jgi:hypothetical protein